MYIILSHDDVMIYENIQMPNHADGIYTVDISNSRTENMKLFNYF